MKITKRKDKMVVELPLWQNSYDAIGDLIGKVPALIGVDTDKDFSISFLCDLGYKGTQQEGMPVIMFEDRQGLEKVCKEFGLDIWSRADYVDERVKEAINNENEAWLAGERCEMCGKKKKANPNWSMCDKCTKEQ